MKLLITGYGRHGKDTVCGILRDRYGLKFESSSFFVAERHVRGYLQSKYGLVYNTLEACYADRVNHRDKWFEAIVDFNTPDLARMGREMLVDNDIYCGLRNIDEFRAMKRENLFDLSVWVDASCRLPPEPETSMTIKAEDCDLLLDNNGTLSELRHLVYGLYDSAPIFIRHLKEKS